MQTTRTTKRWGPATRIYAAPNLIRPARTARILVVDDDPGYRFLLKHILEAQSNSMFVVTAVENGKEALRCLNSQTFDLIISDVYMPEMNGIRLHTILRELPRFENLPFLFVSGYDDPSTVAAVKNPKIEAFVRKGSSTEKLVEWVKYLTTPENDRPMWPPVGG